MSIDATDPEQLKNAVECLPGEIMAGRCGSDGHPPTLSSGQAPVGVENAGITVLSDQSMIISAITQAYPAANIPPMSAAYANVVSLSSEEPAKPVVENTTELSLEALEPSKPWETS